MPTEGTIVTGEIPFSDFDPATMLKDFEGWHLARTTEGSWEIGDTTGACKIKVVRGAEPAVFIDSPTVIADLMKPVSFLMGGFKDYGTITFIAENKSSLQIRSDGTCTLRTPESRLTITRKTKLA